VEKLQNSAILIETIWQKHDVECQNIPILDRFEDRELWISGQWQKCLSRVSTQNPSPHRGVFLSKIILIAG